MQQRRVGWVTVAPALVIALTLGALEARAGAPPKSERVLMLRSLNPSRVGEVHHAPDGSVVAVLDHRGPTKFAEQPLASTEAYRGVLTLTKVRPDRSVAWLQSFLPVGTGEVTVDALTVDGTGNILVVGIASGEWGFLQGTEGGSFLAKFSPDGQPLWGRYTRAVEPTTLHFIDVAAESGGDFIALARFFPTQSTGNEKEVMLIRYDGTTGEPVWGQRFGPAWEHQNGRALALDSSNNIYLVGNMGSRLQFGPVPLTNASGCPAGFIASFDSNGSHRWSRAVEVESFGRFQCVIYGSRGVAVRSGKVIAGLEGQPVFQGVAQSQGSYLSAYDAASGAELWIQPVAGVSEVAGGAPDQVVTVAREHSGGNHHQRLTSFSATHGTQDWTVRYPVVEDASIMEVRDLSVSGTGSVALGGLLETWPSQFRVDKAFEREQTGFLLQLIP